MRAMAGMTNMHTVPDGTQGMPDDNTSEHVNDQVAWWRKHGQPINVESAREIAAWWQSPGYNGQAFTAFAATGEIHQRFVEDIDREVRTQVGVLQGQAAEQPDTEADALNALHALRAYVVASTRAKYTWEYLDSLRAEMTERTAATVSEMQAKAVGYVWGWQDGRNERDVAEQNSSWDFGIAYAVHAAEYHTGKRYSMGNIHDAFRSWRNGGIIG